jgi:mRNA-degrading endonuclease RelE of RelBE toxin-antitoxin system
MTWACELTEDAERDLRGLPKGIQKRVARTLTQMASDPFEGNVKALKGVEWRGVFRRLAVKRIR